MAKFIRMAGEDLPLPGIDDLTLGEMFLMEKVIGARGEALMTAIDEGSIGALIALGLISVRRSGRNMTIEEASTVKWDELTVHEVPDEDGGDPPPIDVADDVKPTPVTASATRPRGRGSRSTGTSAT
jgi:hypothetical protein